MFDFLKSVFDSDESTSNNNKLKKNGGRDHRHNTGNDRTPAQRAGDEKRKKSK